MPAGQTITTFTNYLAEHHHALTNQASFSKNYTAWLDSDVLANSDVQTWLTTQLTSAQSALFQAGQWHIDIQQNSTNAAPVIQTTTV